MYLNSTGVSGADPHAIKNPPINLQLAINTCGSTDTSTDATNCGSCSTEVFIEKKPYPSRHLHFKPVLFEDHLYLVKLAGQETCWICITR